MLELKNKKSFLTKLDNNPQNIFLLYIYEMLDDEVVNKLHITSKYGVYTYGLNMINNLLVKDFEVTVYPIIRIYYEKEIDEFSVYDDGILDYIYNIIYS